MSKYSIEQLRAKADVFIKAMDNDRNDDRVLMVLMMLPIVTGRSVEECISEIRKLAQGYV